MRIQLPCESRRPTKVFPTKVFPALPPYLVRAPPELLPILVMLQDLQGIVARLGTPVTISLLTFARSVLAHSGAFYAQLWPVYACLRPALLRADSSRPAAGFLCCSLLLRLVRYMPSGATDACSVAMTADAVRVASVMAKQLNRCVPIVCMHCELTILPLHW